jgi:hypothetical protein
VTLVSSIKSRGEGWIKNYQLLITMLSLPRLSQVIPDLDLSPIIDPFKGNKVKYDLFIKGFREYIKTNKYLEVDELVLPQVKPRMRMTKGPNLTVTLSSSIAEGKALISNKCLAKSFELYATHTGCREFYDYVVSLASEFNSDFTDIRLGRLVLVPDSLNKHRLIAMVDYWTNTLLAPLEELVRDILRKRFHLTDFLRDHSLGASRVRDHKGKS